jgi:hypothetical protein
MTDEKKKKKKKKKSGTNKAARPCLRLPRDVPGGWDKLSPEKARPMAQEMRQVDMFEFNLPLSNVSLEEVEDFIKMSTHEYAFKNAQLYQENPQKAWEVSQVIYAAERMQALSALRQRRMTLTLLYYPAALMFQPDNCPCPFCLQKLTKQNMTNCKKCSSCPWCTSCEKKYGKSQLHPAETCGAYKKITQNVLIHLQRRRSGAMCWYCFGPSKSKCRRCLQATYCSLKCQAEDWTTFHKHECSPSTKIKMCVLQNNIEHALLN